MIDQYGYSSGVAATSKRSEYLQRNQTLKNERSSWEPLWMDINDFIQPRRGRFFTADKNKGNRKDRRIVNGTARRSSRILASGLMAGLTNPARPWFRLNTPDPQLNEYGPVKTWLATVEDRMRWAYQRSNVYLALHNVYRDLTFGISAIHVEDDTQRLLRAYVFPIGSYCVQNSARLSVDSLFREFQMTTGQMVEKFGEDSVSSRVRDLYKKRRYDDWHEVLHAIQPNREMKPGRIGRGGMAFKSCWMEMGNLTADESEKFLLEAGFEEFPAMCPRWSTTGEDTYGEGPGEEAIGDTKALQLITRDKLRLIQRGANPATQLPSSLSSTPVSLLPGSQVFVDPNGPAQAARPVYEPNANWVTAMEGSEREHERRIKEDFYEDLFMVITNSVDQAKTAYEVARLEGEKMLQLGPVLQRLDEELLNPFIERGYGILWRAGVLPQPPPEAEGMELKVEYISILAQAQRLVGIQAVDTLVGFVGGVAKLQREAGVMPDILDKLNTDQLVDQYADLLGTAPELVRTDEEVAAIRKERAKAMQAQQAAEQAQAAAGAAKDLSQADTGGKNALTDLLQGTIGPRAVG